MQKQLSETAVPNGCISIDHTTPDTYLDNARTGLPSAGNHDSTANAVSKLLECAGAAGPVEMNIIGHGDTGVIITGTGLPPCVEGYQQCIRFDRPDSWYRLILQLKDFCKALVLWACDTGAEDEGAKLLWELANTIGTSVTAPTGLICCKNGVFSLIEPDATWQTANPGPKPPITIHLPPRSRRVIQGLRFMDAEIRNVSFDEVLEIDYLPAGGPDRIFHLTAAQRTEFLQSVDFELPFETDCEVGAIRTGGIRMRLREPLGDYRFSILNDRLLEDDRNKRALYFAFDGFKQFLRSLHSHG